MSKKRVWQNLGALLLILGLVLVYMLVYLLPEMVDINRCRREIKDLNLRIQDLNREVSRITFSDQREESLLHRTGDKFRKRFPVLRNRRTRNKWLKNLTGFIEDSSRKQGISGLVMMDGLDRSHTLITRGLPDRHEIFELMGDAIRNQSDDFPDMLPLQPLLGGNSASVNKIGSRTFFLGFPASMGSGIRLVVDLVKFPFHLEFGKIRLVAGSENPFFLLKFRVFYCQKKSPDQDERPVDRIAGSFIDLNSPLLLKPVYLYFSSPKYNPAVPNIDGYFIFRKTKGDRR